MTPGAARSASTRIVAVATWCGAYMARSSVDVLEPVEERYDQCVAEGLGGQQVEGGVEVGGLDGDEDDVHRVGQPARRVHALVGVAENRAVQRQTRLEQVLGRGGASQTGDLVPVTGQKGPEQTPDPTRSEHCHPQRVSHVTTVLRGCSADESTSAERHPSRPDVRADLGVGRLQQRGSGPSSRTGLASPESTTKRSSDPRDFLSRFIASSSVGHLSPAVGRRQTQRAEDRAVPVDERVVELAGEPGQLGDVDHADRHRGPVPEGVALDLLDGVPEGVPVVEDLAQVSLLEVLRRRRPP